VRVRAPAAARAAVERAEQRLEARVVTGADLEGAGVRVVRVHVMAVHEAVAGTDHSSEEEGYGAVTVARQLAPGGSVVRCPLHHASLP